MRSWSRLSHTLRSRLFRRNRASVTASLFFPRNNACSRLGLFGVYDCSRIAQECMIGVLRACLHDALYFERTIFLQRLRAHFPYCRTFVAAYWFHPCLLRRWVISSCFLSSKSLMSTPHSIDIHVNAYHSRICLSQAFRARR